MRGKTDGADAAKIWASIPDISLRNGLNGRQVGQEYDGLEQAELAWIMGRRYIAKTGTGAGAGNPLLSAMNASAHGLGMGKGVDRLQRLCYQGYMEAYFRAVFGQQVVDLGNLEICDDTNSYLCEELEHYAGFLGGASATDSVDVAFMSEYLFGIPGASGAPAPDLFYNARVKNWVDGTAVPSTHLNPESRGGEMGLAAGIFTMDKGPFLRGKIVEDAAKYVTDPYAKAGQNGDKPIQHLMPRNFGDELAFEALYAHMKSKSFFDWTPDGMVLSKLESPAGDPYSSMELDARQAQLFNIAIQGPAIAKTWTGDYQQQTMPMDRVFVAVVADVVTTLAAPNTGQGSNKAALDNLHTAFKEAMGATEDSAKNTAFVKALQDAKNKVTSGAAKGAYETLIDKLFADTAAAAGANTVDARAAAETDIATDRDDLDKYFKTGVSSSLNDQKKWMRAFEKAAEELRRGALGTSRCSMTNFRLKRVTSSYLSQYSHFIPGKPETRCGLKIGTKDGVNAASGVTVVGEYIIGAWHIGTVLDNAASRSTIGSTVRVAPASMAININVNIEWWSGDKLYRNYMDVEGQVLRRDAASRDLKARMLGIDVSQADMPEAKTWFDEADPKVIAAPPAPPDIPGGGGGGGGGGGLGGGGLGGGAPP